jgi:hypothetical protein
MNPNGGLQEDGAIGIRARMVIQSHPGAAIHYTIGCIAGLNKVISQRALYRNPTVPWLSKYRAQCEKMCARKGITLEDGWHKW